MASMEIRELRPSDGDEVRGLCLVGCEGDRIVATAHPHRRLRAQGCKNLNLIVWDEEEDAMAFWTAIGYRRERTLEFAKELTVGFEGQGPLGAKRRAPIGR
jgi:hypothetical protein